MNENERVAAYIERLGTGYARCHQETAAGKLVKIGKPAVPALLEVLGDSWCYSQDAVVEALGHLADESTIEPLVRMLRPKKDPARPPGCYSSVARVLVAIAGRHPSPELLRAIPKLERLLGEVCDLPDGEQQALRAAIAELGALRLPLPGGAVTHDAERLPRPGDSPTAREDRSS